jgi:hypothetical protein
VTLDPTAGDFANNVRGECVPNVSDDESVPAFEEPVVSPNGLSLHRLEVGNKLKGEVAPPLPSVVLLWTNIVILAADTTFQYSSKYQIHEKLSFI